MTATADITAAGPDAAVAARPAAGPYAYVTSVCRDLARSDHAYRSLLGWWADDGHTCPGRRCRLLLPPGSTTGGIHLVEEPDAAPARPWRVAGGAALEIVTADADAVAVHARTVDGFEIVAGPRPAGATGRLRVTHVRGPDGEVLYLTRILPADRRHVLPARPRTLVGRLYVAVVAVADIDAVRDRLATQLVGTVLSDRRAALTTAALVRGDRPPPADGYRISSVGVGGGALVELDQMPDLAAPPPGPTAGPVTARLVAPGRPEGLLLDLSSLEVSTVPPEEVDR